MDLGLEGKIALITAASEGLGFACAARLAEAGCKIADRPKSSPNLLYSSQAGNPVFMTGATISIDGGGGRALF
jgi:hypothetical protein